MVSNINDTNSYYNNPNWNIMDYYKGRVKIDLNSCIIENVPSDKIKVLKCILELNSDIVITSVVPLTKNVALIFIKDSKSTIKLLKRKKIKICNESNVTSYCMPNSKYCTLFIGNIDKTIHPKIIEENLKSCFNNVTDVRIPMEVCNSGEELINRTINKGDCNWYENEEIEKAKNKNKGYAFIEFSTHYFARENYENFIKNPSLLNRIVTIDWSSESHNKNVITNPLSSSNENKLSDTELYFQGVTDDMKSNELYKVFSKYGLVRNLKLSRDHNSRSDYGFVNFENAVSASNCMKNYNSTSNYGYLRFEYAKIRENNKEKSTSVNREREREKEKEMSLDNINKSRSRELSKTGNNFKRPDINEKYEENEISENNDINTSKTNSQSFINIINTELSLKEDDRLYKALNREYNPLDVNNTTANSSLFHLNNYIASNANKVSRDSGILFYKKQEKFTNINEKKNYVNKFDECYTNSINKIDTISVPFQNNTSNEDENHSCNLKLKSGYAYDINDANLKILNSNNLEDIQPIPNISMDDNKKLGIGNSYGIGNFNIKKEIPNVKNECLNLNDVYKIKTEKVININDCTSDSETKNNKNKQEINFRKSMSTTLNLSESE